MSINNLITAPNIFYHYSYLFANLACICPIAATTRSSSSSVFAKEPNRAPLFRVALDFLKSLWKCDTSFPWMIFRNISSFLLMKCTSWFLPLWGDTGSLGKLKCNAIRTKSKTLHLSSKIFRTNILVKIQVLTKIFVTVLFAVKIFRDETFGFE